jgi:predicted ArsR family transcriptional regulator
MATSRGFDSPMDTLRLAATIPARPYTSDVPDAMMPGLDVDAFTAQVTGLASSFGDPTRRGLYLYLRNHPGATANDLAEHCGVHANVIRHHLERLIASGYVACDEDLNLVGSPRRNALLVALLERSLELLGPEATERMALEVGEQYGRELAESMTVPDSGHTARAAMVAVAEVMTSHGFAAHAEDGVDGSSVVSECCPFGELARHHPVLCAVDRGLVTGILEGLGGVSKPVTLTSRAMGADACRATA